MDSRRSGFPLGNGWFWHPGDQGHSAASLVDFTSRPSDATAPWISAWPRIGGIDRRFRLRRATGIRPAPPAIFAKNLAGMPRRRLPMSADKYPAYAAASAILGKSKFKNYWATDDGVTNADLTLDFNQRHQTLWVEPWETDSIRVRVDDERGDAGIAIVAVAGSRAPRRGPQRAEPRGVPANNPVLVSYGAAIGPSGTCSPDSGLTGDPRWPSSNPKSNGTDRASSSTGDGSRRPGNPAAPHPTRNL